MKPAFLIIFFIGLMATSATAQEHYDGPIIDMHMHAKWKQPPPRRPCIPGCEGAPTLAKSAEEVRTLTFEAMDRNRIVLGMISEDYRYVLDWVKGEEHRFIVGISEPSRVPFDVLRDIYTSGKAQALGEVNEQYYHVPIDDPRLEPVFALAEEMGLPVLVHVGTGGGSDDFPSELGNPLQVATVMRKFPKLRTYLENAGWPMLDEMTGLMYQYPTVYADFSTYLHIMNTEVSLKYLEQLMNRGLGKRIMFGSDQMFWPEVIDETVEAIQGADFLTLEQKADIFYNNAARFLRLSDKEIARHRGK